MRISQSPDTAVVGQALASPLVVRVNDQSGNPFPGAEVTFSILSGGGSLSQAVDTSGSDGQVSTVWTLGTIAGLQQARATATGLSPAGFAAIALAGPPANMTAVAPLMQNTLIGTAVSVPPSVRVTDQFNNPVPGVEVVFKVESGGGSVTGDTAITDASGVAAVTSWTVGTTAGQNTVSATASATGIAGNPLTFTADGVFTAFNIEVRFSPGTTPSAGQAAAFNNAVVQWQSIIVGDQPDVVYDGTGQCGPPGVVPSMAETIDDMVIYAKLDSIDGPGAILGQAGPCLIRNADSLPFLGFMMFDSADVAQLETAGQLGSVILHEMGHVLGIGTVWNLLGLIQNPSDTSRGGVLGADTHFTGAGAIAAFDSLGGAGFTGAKVPVDNTSIPGSADSHWRETVLKTELMTPALNSGVTNPLSAITSASLADMGYMVNISASDPFVVPAPGAVAGAGNVLHMVNDIWDGPIYIGNSRVTMRRVRRR
ncbi:MAG: Ig-like domain-containing protein [Gemmatimonadales bacterium]